MGRTTDAIDEGVAIATAAARLAVKNRILVDTIGAGGAFDAERYAAEARDALGDLATEAEAAADLLEQLRKRARGRYSDPVGTHDYRARDVGNLRRRQKQSAGLAERLREVCDDSEAVHRLVAEARQAAWEDVRSNVDRRLRVEGMRAEQDPHYASMREARMQALRDVDLAALVADARARQDSVEVG